MKTREIIILLLAAAFGAIAIVTWNGEEEAKQQTAKALAELSKTKADAEAASKQAATALAKTKADAEAAAKQAAADLAKAKEDAIKATAPAEG
jgi:cytoskeletal protein RodZ